MRDFSKTQPKSNHVIDALLILLVIFALLTIVGKMDIEDQQVQQEYYCENVDSGRWSDYNNSSKQFCEVGKNEHQ